MLVLTRKAGERIFIGDGVMVEVVEIQGNRVRIGIQAPTDVAILRQELVGRNGKGAAGRGDLVAPPGTQP
jgi:carbon storage regulator